MQITRGSRRQIASCALQQEALAMPASVNRVGLTVSEPLPVFPYEQTLSEPVGMSQRCQTRKSNGKATRTPLFNSTLMILRRGTNIDRFRGRPLINAATAAGVCRVCSTG